MNLINYLGVYVKSINSFLWGKFGIILLLSSGVFFSIKLHFFQIFYFKLWWKNTFLSLFKKSSNPVKKSKNITPFQSLCTALASSVGVGNIAGVATAIAIGGPGSIFWMWAAALIGMMTKYSEIVLGIFFRQKNEKGEWSGGSMYYLSEGAGKNKKLSKFLASSFSLFTVISSFGIGSVSQINKIVINFENSFGIKNDKIILFGLPFSFKILLGIILSLFVAIIVLGGIKKIAFFCEKAVPGMIIFFIFGSLSVIIKNKERLPLAIYSIFSSAFSFKSGLGGCSGYFFKIMANGFKRGVFSNEAGLGSSVMVHSNSDSKEPAIQGMWGIFEVFTDTFLVCTMTSLVILTSGVYDLKTGICKFSDSVMVAEAFNTVFYGFGDKFISVVIFIFSFTTVVGWNHYGTKAWEYLFLGRFIPLYKIFHILSVISGALITSDLAWEISDMFNGLMMIPNIIGVFLLSGFVKKITDNYILREVKGMNISPMLSFYTYNKRKK